MQNLLLLITANTVAQFSPGPDMLLLMRNSATAGRSAALATVFGICTGLSVHVTVSVVGLGTVLVRNLFVFQSFLLGACAYLAYLGYKSLLAGENESGPEDVDHGASLKKSVFTAYREGLWTNLLNAKAALFFLSLFSLVIGPETSTAAKAGYGALLVVQAALLWALFVLGLQTEFLQRYVRRSRPAMDRVFGVLLIGVAMKIFWENFVM